MYVPEEDEQHMKGLVSHETKTAFHPGRILNRKEIIIWYMRPSDMAAERQR